MIRLINITLALLATYGAFVAFRESSLNRYLIEEHRALAAETGYLDMSDSSKVHVVALPSEDPLHFRWRIYVPDKCTLVWKTNQWGDVSDSSTGPLDFIAQVRLRIDDGGFVRVFKDLKAYGGVGSLGGRELREFMRDRWDDVELMQFGADRPAAVDPEDVTTLLRIQMTKEIADEAESVLPASWARQVIPVLYQVEFGTKEAWQESENATMATEGTSQ